MLQAFPDCGHEGATHMSVNDALVLTPAAHLESVAVEVAQLAAEFVRSSHGAAITASTKSTPTDVVTTTDLASEELIRNELSARCPGSSIVGEEFDDRLGQNQIGWIVDPIDGTVNFLYGLPVVSVSIAATLNGQTIAGAVTDMLNGTTYSAALDGGARCDGHDISVSAPESLSVSLIGTGFAYDATTRAEQADVLGDLLPKCRDIRCMGSAALNMCWVGAGLLDGYFERNTKLYDYAAGDLIAREAGALVELPEQSGAGLAFAACPSIADELRAIIR